MQNIMLLYNPPYFTSLQTYLSRVLPLLSSITTNGDVTIDDRSGVEKLEDAKAAAGLLILHALNAISSKGTWIPISQLLGLSSQLSVVSGAGAEVKYTCIDISHPRAYLPSIPKQPFDREMVASAPAFTGVLFGYATGVLAKRNV